MDWGEHEADRAIRLGCDPCPALEGTEMNDHEDDDCIFISAIGIVCGLLLVGLFGAFGPIFADLLR